jgi:hypothetical protein
MKSELIRGADSIKLKPAETEGRLFPVPPAAEVKKLKAAMELAKASAFNFGLLLSNNLHVRVVQLINFLEKKYKIKHHETPKSSEATQSTPAIDTSKVSSPQSSP